MDNNMQQYNEKETLLIRKKTSAHAWGKLVVALLICYFIPLLGLVFLLLGPVMIPANPLLGTGIGQILLGLLTVLAVALLGGRRWLRFSKQGIGHALRLGWPFLAADVALVILRTIRMLQNGEMIKGLPIQDRNQREVSFMINDYDKDMMRELESSEMEQVSGGFDLSATPSAPR